MSETEETDIRNSSDVLPICLTIFVHEFFSVSPLKKKHNKLTNIRKNKYIVDSEFVISM